jgi:hypothetical protein
MCFSHAIGHMSINRFVENFYPKENHATNAGNKYHTP